jgi:hypothetical protein
LIDHTNSKHTHLTISDDKYDRTCDLHDFPLCYHHFSAPQLQSPLYSLNLGPLSERLKKGLVTTLTVLIVIGSTLNLIHTSFLKSVTSG